MLLATEDIYPVFFALVGLIVVLWLLLPANDPVNSEAPSREKRRKRVTVAGEGVLYEWSDDRECKLVDNLRGLLEFLQKDADVFIVCRVGTDAEQEAVIEALRPHSDIPQHYILFHSTQIGRVAIVRQIEPHLHFESNELVRDSLAKHVADLIFVTPATGSLATWVASNV